jgi:hypothetical protein
LRLMLPRSQGSRATTRRHAGHAGHGAGRANEGGNKSLCVPSYPPLHLGVVAGGGFDSGTLKPRVIRFSQRDGSTRETGDAPCWRRPRQQLGAPCTTVFVHRDLGDQLRKSQEQELNCRHRSSVMIQLILRTRSCLCSDSIVFLRVSISHSITSPAANP